MRSERWLVLLAGAFCPVFGAEGLSDSAGVQQPASGNLAVAAGPFVRMVRHNDGSRSITARDETTKELVITTYDPEGNLKLRRNYQLDRYGKPTTFLMYDGAGRPLVRGEYIYDAQDRVIEEKWFELPSERPIKALAHTYDAKTGKALPPQYMHQGSLPPEVVRWLQPDQKPAEGAGKKAPEKSRPSLFGRKKEPEPAVASEESAAGPGPAKGPLQSIFGKRKK